MLRTVASLAEHATGSVRRVLGGTYYAATIRSRYYHRLAIYTTCYLNTRQNHASFLDQRPIMRHHTTLPGDWRCPTCKAQNFSHRTTCWECGERVKDAKIRRLGDWTCEACGFFNFQSRSVCLNCKAEAPIHRHRPKKDVEEKLDDDDEDDVVGGGDDPHAVAEQEPFEPWTCKTCGQINETSPDDCEGCGEPRGRIRVLQEAGRKELERLRKVMATDWLCYHCNTHNFASRPKCRKCNRPRHPKSHIVEKLPPEKWLCPSCNSINDPKRISCWQCNVMAPHFTVKKHPHQQ
jgi:hypothetical protein